MEGGNLGMVAIRLVRLIEERSEELAGGLAQKLRSSERSKEFCRVPADELAEGAREIYHNLGDWLLTKTESDIELRYTALGARRAQQGIPLSQFMYAILVSKEHLWAFLQREAYADRPVELFGELELLQMLDQFFDRAAYFAAIGYERACDRRVRVA